MEIAFDVIAHERHLLDSQTQPCQMIPVDARIGFAPPVFHRTRHPLHEMRDAEPFEVVGNKARLMGVSKY